MQTDIDPRDLIGHRAVDRNGDKIGTVDEVYLDDATGQPEWAAVRTGIFGRDAFVPLTTSEFSGEELRVPYDKSLVKDSPDFGVGQHLSPAQELQLYRYYGLDTPADNDSGSAKADASEDRPTGGDKAADLDFGTVAPAAAAGTAGVAGVAAARAAGPEKTAAGPEKTEKLEKLEKSDGPSTAATSAAAAPLGLTKQAPAEEQTNVRAVGTPAASAPVAAAAAGPAPMSGRPAEAEVKPAGADAATSAPSGPVEITCREERLDITTEWQVTYTARLRKYVTSETVERHVPVVRERVRVERVPVTEGERDALTQEEIAAAVEEVTLREERPVVRKYLVPIERVRLVVERYTDDHVVREELHREHVEIHDDSASAGQAPQSGQSGQSAPSAPAPAAAPVSTPPAAAPQAAGQSRPEPLRSMG